MAEFKIDIRSIGNCSWDDPQAIALRSGHVLFTELVRGEESIHDRYLHAPPIQLAFWLIDNLWRLRWEPAIADKADPDWRLAHELADIGGGYIWPKLRIWSEDPRIGLSFTSDPVHSNTVVRFITSMEHPLFVNAEQFESAIDGFLEQAIDAQSNDRDALKAQFSALKNERIDQEFSKWRRLEAMSGYDVDCAPDQLIGSLLKIVDQFGLSGVGEAIAAFQGEAAARTLEESIGVAKESKVICDFEAAATAARSVNFRLRARIWEGAEEVAKEVRNRLGFPKGPLRNGLLADILKISKNIFRFRESSATILQYGIRLQKGEGEKSTVALHSRWPQSRRFELCRSLGDAIWSDFDALGPMASSKTGRQKFQRAFAQSLLCPWEELLSYMNTSEPSEDDVSAAAKHFDVSEKVVTTVLVNKGIVDRQQLGHLAEAA